MSADPAFRIGDCVWRRLLNPVIYGTATITEVMPVRGGYDYAVLFEGLKDVRWYPEDELMGKVSEWMRRQEAEKKLQEYPPVKWWELPAYSRRSDV